MKFDKNELFLKIKDFVIKNHIKLILIFAVGGGIFGFSGMIMYNETSTFCQKCHRNIGTYFSLDLQIPAHEGIGKGGPGCLTCHKDKEFESQVARSIEKTPKYTERVANLRIHDMVSSKDTYREEECMTCHPEILDLVQVDEPNLPYQVQNIGLKFDHKIHYRFNHFRVEDKERWKQLKIKNRLDEKEQEELALLEKIRLGNCATCHSQQKLDNSGKPYVDKTVNYTARNPIACNGCHEQARPEVHPGNDMEFPAKEVCYKCHHGKLHGKFKIFLADCEGKQGKENCVKCHPQYQENLAKEGVLY